ncbi:DNA polymerase processivity factor-like protein [Ovine gammaherpesvirus 2]|uniref:DNA polymerase processivity factor n=1 Tax=Ovine gammaherpesvirus 2 TaxID=10398 RepID=Q918P2_9GAMA|nr:DNA polymerase processivity factor [Ovine gammaherpesvirus 2]ABB22278.1 DNA polymerase processivity factor-like protein [Ovine gammaherpesvirus 2]WOZ69504.1 ORF59 DNA polymerase processivity subunit [Ovine gammaherpesvirus 2]
METCAVFTLCPAALGKAAKMYEHVKAHLKLAMIQISDLHTAPVLSIISNVGRAGILNFQLTNAVISSDILTEVTEPLAFRNHSFGNTYLHSREFFGSNIEDIVVRFYKRDSAEVPAPEFVETRIAYNNGVTETRHTSTVERHISPVEKHLQKSFVEAKVILSIKTCTMLQKWLRQCKSASSYARLHVNETLGVWVITVGDECKTIEFKSHSIEPADAFLSLDKPGNFGAVLVDCTAVVSLECLIHAISICKVPSVCVPAFKFYSGGIVEVASAHLKQSKNPAAVVSAVLLNAEDLAEKDPEVLPSTSGHPPPSPIPQANLSDSEEDTVDFSPPPPTPTSPLESFILKPSAKEPRPKSETPHKRKQAEPSRYKRPEKKAKKISNIFSSAI